MTSIIQPQDVPLSQKVRVTVELEITCGAVCKKIGPEHIAAYLEAALDVGLDPEPDSYAVTSSKVVSHTVEVNQVAIEVLTQIRGIGTMKAKEVLARFGSLERLATASVDQLVRLPSVGRLSAANIIAAARAFCSLNGKESKTVREGAQSNV